MEIEILNWNKYNPKGDQKKFSWFRMEHMFVFDPEFDEFGPTAVAVWLYLLSYVSLKQKSKFRVPRCGIMTRFDLTQDEILSTLKLFKDHGLLEIHERDATVSLPNNVESESLRYDTIRNEVKNTSYSSPQNPEAKASCLVAEKLLPVREIISGKVSYKIQLGWIDLYEDTDWLCQELKQANLWLAANPKRAPKSQFSRFFTAWLSRGWERHRKSITANPVTSQGGANIDQYFKKEEQCQ